MERLFFDPASRTYREQSGATVPAPAWPASQAVAATIGVARLRARDDAARATANGFAALGGLRDGSLYRSAADADIYYDDNEWIAEDWLDWNALHPRHEAVQRAIGIFASVVHAWDSGTADACPGGVYWTQAAGDVDRNTVSTANGALLGLRLYALERKPVFLYWSRQMLAWLDGCMLAPGGLYWDHVGGTGAIDQAQWSYNQGTMLGAYLELYATTHDAGALAHAEQIAAGTLASFDGRWALEPPEFAAIFFRRLLELAAVDRNQSYVAAAQAYADGEWAQLSASPRLLDHAALVQVYASLALTGTSTGSSR